LIESGEVVAIKILNNGEEEKQLITYGQGDYFGERALIKNEPRAANI